MAVKLLFPTPLFMVDLLDPNLELGLDENYFRLLKREVDEMRKNDPKGRKISNADTGWQSNDGVDKHPAFIKLWRVVEEYITDEIWDFWGLSKGEGHVFRKCCEAVVIHSRDFELNRKIEGRGAMELYF